MDPYPGRAGHPHRVTSTPVLAATAHGEGTVLPRGAFAEVEHDVTELLAVAEDGCTAAARAWLAARGIAWQLEPTDYRQRVGHFRSRQQRPHDEERRHARRRPRGAS